jgi:hypothetical protein
MLGWLGYLIERGVFQYIVVSFLPVGHTHEDIDQVFSRLSVYLACHDALNMEQLHTAIRQSYQTREGQRADCEFWDRCANFSEWIRPYPTNFDGITRFRQFRFYKKDGDVRVQARNHTSEGEEWAGIRGQDAFTDVFRVVPPTRMTNVPDTQRRDIISEKLIDSQRKSILRLAKRRHIPEALIADVIEGMESVGNEDALPFNWDLSKLLNYEEPENVEMKDSDDDAEVAQPHPYEYELETVVVLKPEEESKNAFWLAKVVALGEDNHEGEYQMYWMQSKKDYGLYDYVRNSEGRASLDWVWEEAVQDRVGMCRKGRQLTAKSKVLVENWVERWSQEENTALNDFGIEPDAPIEREMEHDID